MSDAESRILPWPGPGGPRPPGPWGPWRPPSGAWPPGPLPPGPGPFPQPPDVFSAFAWLAKNYRESQAAKEFLKLLIQDMIAEDPTFLANAHATVGVTDGSAAQPGMVGEVVRLTQTVTVPGTQNDIQQIVFGVLPPGDWNVWAFGYPSVPMTSMLISLNPIPAGFSDSMETAIDIGGAASVNTLVSPMIEARTAQPSLVALTVATNQPGAGGAGELLIVVLARRVR